MCIYTHLNEVLQEIFYNFPTAATKFSSGHRLAHFLAKNLSSILGEDFEQAWEFFS